MAAADLPGTPDAGPPAAAAPRVNTPMLAIFPGSTAGYAALEFMSLASGLAKADRDRIALVYVDTDDQLPELIAFREERPEQLFAEVVIPIGVPSDIENITRVNQNENQLPDGAAREPHTYIGGKIPEWSTFGSRGVRNNGHVAARYSHKKIVEGLTDAVTQLISREVNQRQQPRSVQVNIACSIGGGTGSGIVADIACMVDEILQWKGLERRINLWCILPSDVRGTSDLPMRRSNAVACLLEVIALGLAAQAERSGRYVKFMGSHQQLLRLQPIVNELYLVGESGLRDLQAIARIVGMDLFQRALDASGTGRREAAAAIDRSAVGRTDDRRLPLMFALSWPLEVRFPAQETAWAFARVAASHLLEVLASAPQASAPRPPASRAEGWKAVGRAGVAGDPMGVNVPRFERAEVPTLDSEQAAGLWGRAQRMAGEIDARVAKVMADRRSAELERIARAGGATTPAGRVAEWRDLSVEYQAVLDALGRGGVAAGLLRPLAAEHRALRWKSVPYAGDGLRNALLDEYNRSLMAHAEGQRAHQLRVLLQDLMATVGARIEDARASIADAATSTVELRKKGMGSAAWRGRLEHDHPFHHHAFDLPELRRAAGPGGTAERNLAVERLYAWATAGDWNSPLDAVDHGRLLERWNEWLSERGDQERLRGRLEPRLLEFLEQHYLKRFESRSLFDLLEEALSEDQAPSAEEPAAATPETPGQRLLRLLLTAHLERLRLQMDASLVVFDVRVGGEQCSESLIEQVFVGGHWATGQPGQQRALADAVTRVKLERYGRVFTDLDADPHRLQVLYSKHAISLSTVREFYQPQNSSMAAYLRAQAEWERLDSRGQRPPHSSDELERLVCEPDALAFPEKVALVCRVLRDPAGVVDACRDSRPGPA